MKKFILISMLLCLIAGTKVYSQENKYRWDVKILIDTAGLRLYNARAQTENIDNLAVSSTNPRPEKAEMKKPRRASTEKRKVTITGWIVSWGLEDDRDYHLVVKSPDSELTLIAEIPDPTLEKIMKFPGLFADYTAAREFVDSAIGKPHGIKEVDHPVKVRITGIVFFDKMAHGRGHAENGVEIHPVLKIKKVR
jgi:hypothetical protein